MAIETPEELRAHLELAVRVELSTIPPYLYAMYSIEDQASDAAALLRSIVAEEMEHAALAANLLTAVGGTPSFAAIDILPEYPAFLPHHRPPLLLELASASKELIRDTFMALERPMAPGGVFEDDEYHSLGQFYMALEDAFERLDDEVGLFGAPRVERQLGEASFYSPVRYDEADSGGLVAVHDLDSALQAIEIIVHQGEGLGDERWADPSHQELTHYYKLRMIEQGEVDLGPVRPTVRNPRTAALPAELRPASELFNASMRYVFLILDRVYSGGGSREQLVDELYLLMTRVLAPVARALTSRAVGGGEVAGPTFERYDFGGAQPEGVLMRLGRSAVEACPELDVVVAALERLAPLEG
ncbi:MAG: ferritin-like protein [Dehalococcoidia bacterium]